MLWIAIAFAAGVLIGGGAVWLLARPAAPANGGHPTARADYDRITRAVYAEQSKRRD